MNKLAAVAFVGLVGCASNDAPGDARDDSFTTDGKLDGFQCTPQEAAAILQVVNTASLNVLKNDVGLTVKAADNIVAVRKGDDELANTSDDVEFGSLAQLDAVPYIGPVAFQALLDYVHDADLVDDAVPTDTWTVTTVANGSYAHAALTPDGKLVMTYNANNAWKLRLANGTEVALPTGISPFEDDVHPAVDAAGIPHVFYEAGNGFAHVSYRNGSLVTHDPLKDDDLVVAQNADGKIYALGREPNCSGCSDTLTLYSVAANGTTPAEPLWSVSSGPKMNLTVAADGTPSLVFGYGGAATYARKTPNAWLKVDASSGGDSFATTGGANAVVFAARNGMKAFRQSGMTFSQIYSDAFTAYTPQLSAAADKNGTSHACYVHGGNAIHLQIDATGDAKEQSLGNAESCRLTVDDDGKIHAFLDLGILLNHATLE
jgi:hypothetical protein